jgi:hypothetical protein
MVLPQRRHCAKYFVGINSFNSHHRFRNSLKIVIVFTIVLVTFMVTVTKIPERNKRRKDLFWLMVSEVSVHHGGEGMVEQGSSRHGGQEAERVTRRGQGQCTSKTIPQ